MKKQILLISLIVGLLFAGCGKTVPSSDQENIIVVATDPTFPPFESLEGNETVGFDIDLINEIGRISGLKMKIVNTSFDGLIAGIQSQEFDLIIAGLTANEERRKSINFSDSYYSSSQVIIVREDNAEITTFDDLNSRKIGYQRGSTSENIVKKYEKAIPNPFPNSQVAILALINQKVDAVVIDNEPAKKYVAEHKGIKIVESASIVEDYAIGISKDRPELLDTINKALKTLKENGKYDELKAKWKIP